MKKILAIKLREYNSGISKYRIIDPHINIEDFHIDFGDDEDVYDMDLIKKYDAIFFHSALIQIPKFVLQIKNIKSLGIKCIMDIDDYWEYDHSHPYYQYIKKLNLGKITIDMLKNVDVVTTTTTTLYDKIKPYNNNVFVIPNAINFDEPQMGYQKNISDTLNVGYIAGVSHYPDIKILRGLFTHIKKFQKSDSVQMRLCGINVTPRTATGSEWHKMETVFTDNYNIENKKYVEYLQQFEKQEYEIFKNEFYKRIWTEPISSYMKIYDEMDICLAPLKDCLFNNCKSNLKLLEAGAKKKPVVCSASESYLLGTTNKKNVMIIPSNKEHKLWLKYTEELIKNEDMRINIGCQLHEIVKNRYNLKEVSKLRSQIYSENL